MALKINGNTHRDEGDVFRFKNWGNRNFDLGGWDGGLRFKYDQK